MPTEHVFEVWLKLNAGQASPSCWHPMEHCISVLLGQYRSVCGRIVSATLIIYCTSDTGGPGPEINQGRTQFEGLGPPWVQTIHNFITLSLPFLRKSPPTRPHGLNFPRFPEFERKNYDEEKKIGKLVLANREKGHESIFGTTDGIQLSRPNRGRLRPGKSTVVWNRRRGSDLEQSPDLWIRPKKQIIFRN